MSWETLRALANAIDAKSRWTAGHSTRVTNLALEIAAEIHVSERNMEILHRGGLLHDLGKIGVPREILDFPGPLEGEARRVMETHPVVGARILEPIREESGRAFDPDMVGAFTRVLDRGWVPENFQRSGMVHA